NAEETTAKKVVDSSVDPSALMDKITALQTQIQGLQTTLDQFAETQKELEQLRGRVAITEGDTTALQNRVKTLETEKGQLSTRVKDLEGDYAALQEQMREYSKNMGAGSQQQLTAKPAWVKAAVRFFNHEGRSLKINVNGVWHTLKDGENTIWVNYGPVHVYRYTGHEPRTFAHWKSYQDGYVMDFDVGER
ncbi:MAG: hypothetical protein KDA84_30300, partial [Planctomycetaceae bacterium]|nr:hypothetical protein [Planctomycetaceae bacterium]